MSDFDKNRFASKNQSGSTPSELFQVLDGEFMYVQKVRTSKSQSLSFNKG